MTRALTLFILVILQIGSQSQVLNSLLKAKLDTVREHQFIELIVDRIHHDNYGGTAVSTVVEFKQGAIGVVTNLGRKGVFLEDALRKDSVALKEFSKAYKVDENKKKKKKRIEHISSSDLEHLEIAVKIYNENLLKKIISIPFSNDSFQTVDGKTIETGATESEFTILNFNYYFCDVCKMQLAEMVKLKKGSKRSISIISFFATNKSDIQDLIDQYKNDIEFVSDASAYINPYEVKKGVPLTYILQKEKIVYLKYTTENKEMFLKEIQQLVN
jgi:hypothetical protein